jgi:DNA helicase-2/ATP-dependent DNA helicase PcrA
LTDPDRTADLLADLNDAQREAVLATTGPLAILAGAGTGKTRVISRRTAYAIASGAVRADQVLVVTFTDKAASEMIERLRVLALPAVTARTFHAHALSQLRHFWPERHDGRPLPEVLDSKIPIVGRLARDLPGGYRFTPAKDLADEIEWAKSHRIGPARYADLAGDRTPPVPVELFVRLYAGYERAKDRAGRMDFDDMLTRTVELLEADDAAREVVRARKSWFSVDEYQDTNPLQERLLELWLGDRDDLCVVGDEDQTIYAFTGATATFLSGFADRHSGARVVELTENYRSTPQVLELANRLIARTGRSKRLVATRPAGPPPTIRRFADGEEELAALATWARDIIRRGTDPGEVAVLVRTNAQLEPVEEALTRAGVGFRVRGVRFFDRRDVRTAIAQLRRIEPGVHGEALVDAVRERWRSELGWEPGVEPEGEEGRDRSAAFETLLAMVAELARTEPAADADAALAELGPRAARERDGAAGGVNLLTYHRAKGLEWDAVALPMLEEGSLPIRHAFDDDDALAEERRLLYVGLTRARVHLALTWAERRIAAGGREGRRHESRFLRDLRGPAGPSRARRAGGPPTIVQHAGPPAAPARRRSADADDPLMAALRAWRLERAREDAVPAYVIAHDATLEAISEARPTTIPALRRVRGMGPSRIDRYGDAIVAIVGRVGRD